MLVNLPKLTTTKQQNKMRIFSITYDKAFQNNGDNELYHELVTEEYEADDFKMLLQDKLATLFTNGGATHFFAHVENITSVLKPEVGVDY